MAKKKKHKKNKFHLRLPRINLENIKLKPKFLWLRQHPKFIVGLIGIMFLLSLAWVVYLFRDVPNPTKLTRTPAPVSTQILDRNGKLLYEIFQDKNRTPIKITDLPDYVKQASIAIEDKNFYSHHGIDLVGVARAAL